MRERRKWKRGKRRLRRSTSEGRRPEGHWVGHWEGATELAGCLRGCLRGTGSRRSEAETTVGLGRPLENRRRRVEVVWALIESIAVRRLKRTCLTTQSIGRQSRFHVVAAGMPPDLSEIVVPLLLSLLATGAPPTGSSYPWLVRSYVHPVIRVALGSPVPMRDRDLAAIEHGKSVPTRATSSCATTLLVLTARHCEMTVFVHEW